MKKSKAFLLGYKIRKSNRSIYFNPYRHKGIPQEYKDFIEGWEYKDFIEGWECSD